MRLSSAARCALHDVMQRLATAMIVCTMVCSTTATSLQHLRGGGKALKTEEDKALYALGCNVGRQIGYAHGQHPKWAIGLYLRAA